MLFFFCSILSMDFADNLFRVSIFFPSPRSPFNQVSYICIWKEKWKIWIWISNRKFALPLRFILNLSSSDPRVFFYSIFHARFVYDRAQKKTWDRTRTREVAFFRYQMLFFFTLFYRGQSMEWDLMEFWIVFEGNCNLIFVSKQFWMWLSVRSGLEGNTTNEKFQVFQSLGSIYVIFSPRKFCYQT